MKAATDVGMNRTGIGISPLHSRELIEGALAGTPSSMGDEHLLGEVREQYAREAGPVGTVPPPSTLKGAAAAVVQALKGQKLSVLLDKLGERLAFERSGARLYEAVLSKAHGEGTWQGGPTMAELQQIHDDELRHVDLLRTIVVDLGGDPTVQTPSADVIGVATMGIVQVVTDPRTTLAQSLTAMLAAELVDNDGYTVLIQLAEVLGQDDMAMKLRGARADEDRHLERMRLWVSGHAIAEGEREIQAKA
jgi:bacterioferritin (cytochrome b1)